MDNELKIRMYAFTVDCADPYALAEFYAKLLNWDIPYHDEDFACIGAPGKGQGAYPGITFQRDPEYVPPVWPAEAGMQQTMAHLDFAVNDLGKAVDHAIRCGAVEAQKQYSEGWRVMVDPAGHPFCLCSLGAVFDSADFALL